eukprot:768772-Hanusia_phi.AAC.6
MEPLEECKKLKKENKILQLQLAAAQAEAKKAHLQLFSKQLPHEDSSFYSSIPSDAGEVGPCRKNDSCSCQDLPPRPPAERFGQTSQSLAGERACRRVADAAAQTDSSWIDFSSRSNHISEEGAQTKNLEDSKLVALQRKMSDLLSFMSRTTGEGDHWERSSECQGSFLLLQYLVFDLKQQLASLLNSLQPMNVSGAPRETNETSRIHLSIHSAENLPKVDTFGHIDAYCVVDFQNVHYKTKVIRNNPNPTFNEVLVFERIHASLPENIRIEVKDRNLIGRNTVVGFAELKTALVSSHGEVRDQKLQLYSSDGSPLTDKKSRLASLFVSAKMVNDGMSRSTEYTDHPTLLQAYQPLKHALDNISSISNKVAEIPCTRILLQEVEYLSLSPGEDSAIKVYTCISLKSATCKVSQARFCYKVVSDLPQQTCTVHRARGRAVFNEWFELSYGDVHEEVVLTVYHCSESSRQQVGFHRMRADELLASASSRSISIPLLGADVECRLNMLVERMPAAAETNRSPAVASHTPITFTAQIHLDKHWLRHHSKSDLEVGSTISDLLDLLASGTVSQQRNFQGQCSEGCKIRERLSFQL